MYPKMKIGNIILQNLWVRSDNKFLTENSKINSALYVSDLCV